MIKLIEDNYILNKISSYLEDNEVILLYISNKKINKLLKESSQIYIRILELRNFNKTQLLNKIKNDPFYLTRTDININNINFDNILNRKIYELTKNNDMKNISIFKLKINKNLVNKPKIDIKIIEKEKKITKTKIDTKKLCPIIYIKNNFNKFKNTYRLLFDRTLF